MHPLHRPHAGSGSAQPTREPLDSGPGSGLGGGRGVVTAESWCSSTEPRDSQSRQLPACRRHRRQRPESANGPGQALGAPCPGVADNGPASRTAASVACGEEQATHTPPPGGHRTCPLRPATPTITTWVTAAAHPPCPPHRPPASRKEKQKPGSHQRESGYHQRLRTRLRRGRLPKGSMEPPALPSARCHCEQPRPSRRPALLPFLPCCCYCC